MNQALYMMRMCVALMMFRQLEEALYHAFECNDDEDDRFQSDDLSERLNEHRRIITLTGDKTA